jgi:hypothetical protein
MASEFTIEKIEERIVTLLEERKHNQGNGFSLVEHIAFRHVVMEWVFTQPPELIDRIVGVRGATEGNITLLNPLWDMFVKYGIALTIPQKVELYQDLLDD